MTKREFKKTTKNLQKLSQKVVNTNLETSGKQVEKLTKDIFTIFTNTLYPKRNNKATFGQKTADLMTKWAGSWFFILGFFLFLVIWMILNSYYWINYLSGDPFDPFPFILLNLILSCLAAIQAPIILMSQNREVQRDRIRAEYDYQVNRIAEKEIREIKKQLDRIERKINK
jgi:uncharacterized membrane protein